MSRLIGCEVKKTHDPNHTFTAYEKEYVQPELTPEQVALQKQRYGTLRNLHPLMVVYRGDADAHL